MTPLNWVYVRSEPQLWTVGHYRDGLFQPDSDHSTREDAAARCSFLNGSTDVNLLLLQGLLDIRDSTAYDQAAKSRASLALSKAGVVGYIDTRERHRLIEAAPQLRDALAHMLKVHATESTADETAKRRAWVTGCAALAKAGMIL